MDIIDIQDAALYAETIFQKWKAEFEKEFNQPIAEIVLAKWWNSIPESVKDELKKQTPDAVERLNKRLKGDK